MELEEHGRADGWLIAGGPLERFVSGKAVHHVSSLPVRGAEVVLAARRLQDVVDYRAAIRDWFGRLGVGGHLILTVPHAFLYDRRLALPSPWNSRAHRLYTPASLAAEMEEALPPNTYRVRFLGDLDDAYDYHLSPDVPAGGSSDVALVLERIAPPSWGLEQRLSPGVNPPLPAADFAFAPARTRIETDRCPAVRRILILKLDHLGDLVMGLPALERARRYFPDATIDLAVGSWNADLARGLGLVDRVIAFDAFPRNSSEVEPNVMATLGQFQALVTDEYDLAIDLRADTDTRPLLRTVRAPLKAGIGTRAQFPFIDIALPLGDTRNEAARVRDERLGPSMFHMQGSGRRGPFSISSDSRTVERDCAIIWGPYLTLDPGDYLFDFYLDLEERRGDGILRLDVALDRGQATGAEMIVSAPTNFHLPFRVERPGTLFEARIATVGDHPSIGFSFHGGRLIKRGPGNVLHQSEYGILLLELVRLRTRDLGFMTELTP